MRKNRKKKDYIRPVIVGFLALYLVSMLLSTYLVKCKYEEEYNDYLYTKRDEAYVYLASLDITSSYWTEEVKDYFTKHANMVCAKMGSHDKYQQIAAAIYDIQGNRISMTSNVFGYTELPIDTTVEEHNGETVYLTFKMEDYMTEKEIRELAAYYDPSSEVFEEVSDQHLSQEYDPIIYLTADNPEPMGMDILKRTVDGIGESSVSGTSIHLETVWKWRNENVSEETVLEGNRHFSGANGIIVYFPYIAHGTKYWDIWQQDEWLQGFPEKYEKRIMEEGSDEEGLAREVELLVTVGPANSISTTNMYRICLRQTAHPWLAAMDYMKYVYVMGLLLTIVCIIKVLYSTHKTYEERAKLEQTRRDFTNAVAHELKTPLGVIRGFAENLKENTVAEKKDYYLNQIIGQTEQMDDLVKEMINISKLDSEEFVLKKEQASMITIIREQMSKFDFSMEEKNLHLIYEVEEDFCLEGDIYQLRKVLWNLLANAVEYNRQDGSIWIFSDKDKVVIENTGEHIPEEKLPYVFDLFYTGDESRHDRGKHMGLGLYLAKKICSMHDLKLEICNTDTGVKITISRWKN